MNSLKIRILFVSVILDAAVILEDIGVCYIVAYLREHGYEVKIVSDMMSRLSVDDIVQYKPDLVGFSTYNQTMKKIQELSIDLKKKLPNTKIMYGGSTATFYGEDLMQNCPELDFIIQGESEMAVKLLADCLSNKEDYSQIQGLIYRKDGQVLCNPPGKHIEDLDILPMPARDILKDHNLKIAILSESRGCTHNCYFCSSHNFWKNPEGNFRWRSRSIPLILDEIQELYTKYQIRHFWFSDPSFEDPGFNEERIAGICNGLLERNLKISFIIYVRGSFYHKVSPELMELLIHAGLSSVFIGAESINESDRKIYGKAATSQDVINSMQFFHKYEVSVDIGFINFNPYSTFEGLKQNCDFLWKYGYFVCEHHLSKVMVFKGSRLYQRLLRDNLLYDGSCSNLFGYHFVDSRIEKLCDFLEDYMKRIQQGTHVFEEITLLTHLQQSRLACLNRRLDLTNESDRQVKSSLTEYMAKLDYYCNQINDEIHEWYHNLLHLAEEDEKVKNFEQYSMEYLNLKHLQQYTNEIKRQKILLIKRLGRSGYAYLL